MPSRQTVYNATINENSVGKVYVESHHKMGIFNDDPDVKIKFKIVSGDPESFFKAEAETVGNFVFLLGKESEYIHMYFYTKGFMLFNMNWNPSHAKI